MGIRIHSEQPDSPRFWKVNKHCAFSIPRKALGLRPNDQSCHHETWLHLDFVDRSHKWSNQDYYNGIIRLKERPADSSYGTQKTTYQRGYERPFALTVNAQPLAHPWFLRLHLSSSRSDLMSSDVFPDMPQVRHISVLSTFVLPMRHFPSRTPCPSCPP